MPEAAAPMLDVQFGQASDFGKIRTNNEDSMGSYIPSSRRLARSHGYLFAVADGVGGMDLGEVASATAIKVLTEEFPKAPAGTMLPNLLPRLVEQANTAVHDRPANPRAGLLWQPIEKISLYSNYSSNYGDSGPLVTVGAQKFLPPQSADQVEFGVKSEWLGKKLTASAAVYRIIKHNVPAPDPKNPLVTIAIGTARTEGVELDVAGQITPDLRVIASYSNLQDLVTSDTNCNDPNNSNCSGIPSQQGLPFDGIAHVTGSLWATWQPHQGALRGLTVGGGLNGHSAEHYFQFTSLPVFTNNPTACQAYPADPTQCTSGFEDDRVPNASQVNLMAAWRHTWGRKQISAQFRVSVTKAHCRTRLFRSCRSLSSSSDRGRKENTHEEEMEYAQRGPGGASLDGPGDGCISGHRRANWIAACLS